MAQSMCGVDGCDRAHVARGLCRMHYMRVWKSGDVGGAAPSRMSYSDGQVCSIDGCGRDIRSRGMCTTHYMRTLNYGDPLISRRQSYGGAPCCVDDCERNAQSLGMCGLHYGRFMLHGSTDKPERRKVARRGSNPDLNRLRQQRYSLSPKGKLKHSRRRAVAGAAEICVISDRDWRSMVARFRGRCAYCGSLGEMTRDHVIPLARGGRHAIGNILPACRSCNSSKRDRLLVEWRASKNLKAVA
jgi:5-methylcytosine-specific restriction endonuclease McrA